MYLDDFLLDSKLKNDDFQGKTISTGNLSVKTAVSGYIQEKVIIKSDGIQLTPKLKDIKLTDNEINIYLDYPVEKIPQMVSVKSFMMTGIYNDQSNMVILKVREFEEGVKLNAGMAERTFIIK